jgi:hypothetical protein
MLATYVHSLGGGEDFTPAPSVPTPANHVAANPAPRVAANSEAGPDEGGHGQP